MSVAHPFPSCIDCKLYKGLCNVHARQLGRKAGVQTEPYGSAPPLTKSVSSPPTSPTTQQPSSPPQITIPDKDLESKIRAESAACIDCKIYKTMCGIHASKLKALTARSNATSPQSARSPGGFYKAGSPAGRTMTGKNITRTTSFTGLSAMRVRTPVSPTSSEASLSPTQNHKPPTPTSMTKCPKCATTKTAETCSKCGYQFDGHTPDLKSLQEASSKKATERIKSEKPLPVHEDGVSQCPSCHCERDADDALFCGDCGYNYQTGASDTSSTTTTVSNSSTNSSATTVSDTVCKDCGAVRDPPDSLFCGECGYRFPASGDEVTEQAF